MADALAQLDSGNPTYIHVDYVGEAIPGEAKQNPSKKFLDALGAPPPGVSRFRRLRTAQRPE